MSKKPTDTLDDFGLLKKVPTATPSTKPPLMPFDAAPEADLDARPGQDEESAWQDIIGVLGGVHSNKAFRDAVAARLTKNAPVIQRVTPTKKRRWSIPFGPTAIPPNSSVVVTHTPRCIFRGEKMINSGDATGLFLKDLFVGRKSQLPASAPSIPLQHFSPQVLDNGLLMDTCEPGLNIAMQIMNAAALTLTFSMTIFGSTIV